MIDSWFLNALHCTVNFLNGMFVVGLETRFSKKRFSRFLLVHVILEQSGVRRRKFADIFTGTWPVKKYLKNVRRMDHSLNTLSINSSFSIISARLFSPITTIVHILGLRRFEEEKYLFSPRSYVEKKKND